MQHLQSGDAKVTMARDGQDRFFGPPFDGKSREKRIFGDEGVVFAGQTKNHFGVQVF